ncbi:unnamed protein product [Strongylus vulgaris]|uniref:Uncharacterized protein n=1 Tax=Strongylus vulgaris TaxID=40348 RepID=A0A3P7IUT4_STRVU|nr:unnamed protein product [Strongylus vulgaris]
MLTYEEGNAVQKEATNKNDPFKTTRSKSMVEIRKPKKFETSSASTSKRDVVPEPVQNFVPQITVPRPFNVSIRKPIVNTYSTKFVEEMVSKKKQEEEEEENQASKPKQKPIVNTYSTKFVEEMVSKKKQEEEEEENQASKPKQTKYVKNEAKEKVVIRSTHSSKIRMEAIRQREQKLYEERHKSEKFWEERRDEMDMSRVKLLSSIGSLGNIHEEIERKTAEKRRHTMETAKDYEKYLAEMQQRFEIKFNFKYDQSSIRFAQDHR